MHFLLSADFSWVFRRKHLVIEIGLSGRVPGGRAGGTYLVNIWLTFWQIQFSHKAFNLRASNFTHGFFRVSDFM